MIFTLSEYTLRVIGVVLILAGIAVYRSFRMPPGMRARTLAYVAGVEPDSHIARKLGMFQLIAAMGVVILITGFLMQFVANFASSAPLRFVLTFKSNY
jgi:hypothetical protein